MTKTYQPVVLSILNQFKPKCILDVPSGSGWLHGNLDFETQLDGIDLFEEQPKGYTSFRKADLDQGLPEDMGRYQAIVCCEGIEHFGNPELFMRSAFNLLEKGGKIIITTPNVWYPEARLQFFLRGFLPSFPCLVGKIQRGTHMHIMPWSFPQLHLYLKLNGFDDIVLHDVQEPKPKRFYEWALGLPQWLYCRHKKHRSQTSEERDFWTYCGMKQSLYGRRLVVSAVKS